MTPMPKKVMIENMTTTPPTRRGFLGCLGFGSLQGCSRRRGASDAILPKSFDPARYRTPYKYGKLVLSGSGEEGAFDRAAVDCPYVFRHGDRFYMTYVSNDGIGYQTGLASSTDLIRWERLGCIMKRDPDNPIIRYNVALNWIVRENQLRSPGRLKKIDGRFLGVYHAYPNPGYESGPAVIGLCWSDDLLSWELGDLCLHPEEGGHWEQGGLYKPCLVEHDGAYFIFYNAKTPGQRWVEQTGVATSADLNQWKRFEGNPILPNGGLGSWDEGFASDPCVVLDDNLWVIFYYGLDKPDNKARELLAAGKDPFHPVKVDEILIDVGPEGSVDAAYAHKPSVVYHDGALYHFYCAVSGQYPNEVRGISVARSKPWS